MAAQSLVRRSYADPVETYETNVLGSVNVLEAARRTEEPPRVVINVTTDKVYENLGRDEPFREDEPKGGHDPYSNSKACSELVTAAYRNSFFANGSPVAVASARAGNVIGGGDWGEDRLVPDLIRGALAGRDRGDPQPRRDPPLAARAEPAQRIPAAGGGDVGVTGVRGRLELRSRRARRSVGAPRRRPALGALGRRDRVGARRGRTSARGALPAARLLQGA